MKNPNKPIHDIDEAPKGRQGIEEMLKQMFEENDENSSTAEIEYQRTTA